MKYIIEPRQGAKTTKIIKQVIKNNGYLLVHNEEEANRLRNIYPQLTKQIFSWHSLPDALMGKTRRKVYIDNADYFIREIVGECYDIEAITLNKGKY
jgi:hypothetical protein